MDIVNAAEEQLIQQAICFLCTSLHFLFTSIHQLSASIKFEIFCAIIQDFKKNSVSTQLFLCANQKCAQKQV